MKKVSIIIPVYNVEDYIEKCIDSVINQTYKNLEIIIINDGSTDKSLDIINNYKNKDSRIIVYNQSNQGVAEARNKGLEIARGEYIAFIDSDDYVDYTYIEKLKSVIKEEDAYSCCGYIREENTYIKDDEKNKLCLNPSVVCKLYNRKFINDIKFSNHRYGEDLIFTYKQIIKNNNFTIINEPLYTYTYNKKSISHTWHNQYKEIFNILEEIYSYQDKRKMNEKERSILEFIFIWYGIFGNLKRACKSAEFSEKYIEYTIKYIEDKFPIWYNNKYIEKYIWDTDILNELKEKKYKKVEQIYKERYSEYID